ncbi:type II toxin-antitoxin system RelE/ParE family toxin [Endozoicomonas acroporae]|nr:type II toxin-antitoxin system RelE/ParE family toxin [Endozoicomonas acroporae]
MAKVILTQDARQDILDIIAYTRDHFGKPQAVKITKAAVQALNTIQCF